MPDPATGAGFDAPRPELVGGPTGPGSPDGIRSQVEAAGAAGVFPQKHATETTS